MSKMRDGFLFVYVMYSGGLRKIGFSVNPYQRIKMVRSPSGAAIELEFVGPHSANLRNMIEAQTHNHLRNKRMVDEWFYISAEDAIAAIIRNIIIHDEPFCLDDLIDHPEETKHRFHRRILDAHEAIGIEFDPRLPVWFPDPKAGTNAEVAKRHGVSLQTAVRTAGMSRREAIRRADRERHDKCL